MDKIPETVLDHKCLLGEGPVWDSKKQRILWIDILNGVIHQYYPETGEHKSVETGQMVGSIALRKSGGIVAALQNGFAFIDLERGDITMIADPEADLPDNRFNEGKCDPAGRFWAGTMSLVDKAEAGSLYALEKDMSVTLKARPVSISNGLAWSLDHKTVYYIDTPTHKVVAFDYDTETGNIGNKRIVIEMPAEYGSPDGMTIDGEGMLWIGHWDGWQITRWDPMNKSLLLRIGLPVARVTSCAFGGPTLEDIYITCAREGLSAEDLQAQPLAGSLFVIRNSGYKGVPAFEFGG